MTGTAVLVLGARTVDGRAGRLLAARLGSALELLTADPELPVVVSGRGEAPVMADWLRAHGVAEDRIHVEEDATSTNENLENAHRMLPGIAHWWVVTNSFHRWRTRVWAWHLGIPVTVVSARTVGHYRVTMFAREALAFPHSALRVAWRRLKARRAGHRP